jgi:hypothetical protein
MNFSLARPPQNYHYKHGDKSDFKKDIKNKEVLACKSMQQRELKHPKQE